MKEVLDIFKLRKKTRGPSFRISFNSNALCLFLKSNSSFLPVIFSMLDKKRKETNGFCVTGLGWGLSKKAKNAKKTENRPPKKKDVTLKTAEPALLLQKKPLLIERENAADRQSGCLSAFK